MSVHDINTGHKYPFRDGSEPPMELTERVVQLENHVSNIRVDLAVIKQRLDSELPHLATHSNVVEAKNSLILWFVSAIGVCFLTLAGIMAKGFGWLN